MKKIAITILLFCYLSGFAGCAFSKEISDTRFALNTVVTITLYDWDNDVDGQAVLKDAFVLINQYEKQFSSKMKGSDISRINQNAGIKPVQVTDDTYHLLSESIRYSQWTSGVFDVSCEPLVALWDIDEEPASIPSKAAIEKTSRLVDYNKIYLLENNKIFLRQRGMAVSLGSCAKGFIADCLKSYLLQHGISRGLINLGGNIVVFDEKKQQKPFNIGIQLPFGAQNEYIGSIEMTHQSVVTSGVYERYIKVDGKSYHHLLNAQTGYPENNELLSVTIVSNSSEDGDFLSTACYLLGDEKGRALSVVQGVEGIFITRDGIIWCNEKLKSSFRLNPAYQNKYQIKYFKSS